ncbi:hypothetical protein CDL60_13785 [Roseateles noduli]|nr:hypothetical protein CDL60_13785 [Roseateles noduli]
MSVRFLSLTPLAAALLMPLGASAIATVTASPPMCGGEAMPVIEPRYKMACALDHGVLVDSPQDQGDNIRSALADLTSSETGLFFPRGRYLVSGDLPLRSGNVLVGSRVGKTNFVNPASATSQITETLHSAKDLLIDRLVLDNITAQTFHSESGTVIRDNTFRNTTTRNAQIRLGGASVVTGNVLLREPQHPGIGVQLVGARNAQVIGNWIGEDQARRDARRATDRPTLSDAHFTYALLSEGAMTDVLIRNNQVTLTLETAPADQRYLAFLTDADRLTLDGNYFGLINGIAGVQPPSVTLRAPQDVTIVANTFDKVPLHLIHDDGKTPRPTKRTHVVANTFAEATVDTTQATRAYDGPDTTLHDVTFTRNRFHGGRAPCMLSAPLPTTRGMTYAEADNFMDDGHKTADACHLRNISLQEALTHVPSALHGAKAPALVDHRKPDTAPPPAPSGMSQRTTSPSIDNRTDVGSPTLNTAAPGLRVPPTVSAPPPARVAPPAAPADPGWRVRLSAKLDKLQKLLDSMKAMFGFN